MNLKHYYCNQQGLLGILEDKEIWATNIQFLNDGSEYQYTMNLISRLLPNLVLDTVEEDLRTYVEQTINSYLSSVGGPRIFVASFSELEDDLTMWRAYGKGGGYSLGVDFDERGQSLKFQRFDFAKCEYSQTDQEEAVLSVLARLIDLILLGTKRVGTKQEPNLHLASLEDPALINVTVSELQDLAARFKHPAFEPEKEWRLIRRSPLYPKIPYYRPGRYCPIPYWKFKLNEQRPVKRIIIGPNQYQDLAYEALHSRYTAINAPYIGRSSIPFRSTW